MPIDINCDMGESFGRYTLGLDAEIIPLISSANIACGFHAGDPSVMRRTVQLAAENGVGIGAHPGFPDLAGFGRRNMNMLADELSDSIIYQVGALTAFAQVFGATLQHVKPHGALYNMAAGDESLAKAIVDALLSINPDLILFGLAGAKILDVAREAGLRVAREVFADRAYNEDGTLVSRNQEGAVMTDSTLVAERVLAMAKHGKVTAVNGQKIDLEFDTVCVHGDTAGAVEHARQIVETLKKNRIEIVPIGKH